MIQICQKDKEKVYEAIRTGKIDAAGMSFPNLVDDIILIMKRRELTDAPFAVTEAEFLAERGWNFWDNERDVSDGLFSESVMRKLLVKYKSEEWVSFYNSYIQEHLMKELDIQPCVHILDCTKVLVNLDYDNYGNSSVVKIDG